MANNSINLVGLDFAEIKANLISYLKRSDSPFKDADFDGSNINALIDVLAYNTYQNSFYLNMVGSEMFLDTAQLRDSVISHAKELNYVPRSFNSAEAKIFFTVTPSNPIEVLLVPKGTSFTTRIGSSSYSFVTDTATSFTANTDDKFYINLTVYEGNYVTDTFVYQSSNTNQRFVLSNPTIDIRSLVVLVAENNGANLYTYTRATTFLGLDSTSQSYFLQPAENSQYEIVLGDGVIGRKPKNGAVISVEYRICNGELPNGARVFDIDGPISGESNISTISTTQAAIGGSINESIDSIKYNAPRHYQNQERAITSSDYESLLIKEFPEIEDISVFGGEDRDPPIYGRVFIAASVNGGNNPSDGAKQRYYNFIRPRSTVSIEPVFIDADFLYAEVLAVVRYNTGLSGITPADLEATVRSTISSYNSIHLNGFNKTLRYSKLVEDINNCQVAVISNDLYVSPFKKMVPTTGEYYNDVLEFGFPLTKYYTISHDDIVQTRIPAITSTNFTYKGKVCFFKDDGNGLLKVYSVISGVETIVATVGTVDYNTGKVIITNLFVDSYSPASGIHMHVYASPASNDISSTKNQIFNLVDSDIEVEIVPIKL